MDARRINELCEQNQDRIIGIRRQIHSHPELSDQETETSKLVQAELRRLGVETHTFAGMTAVMLLGALVGSFEEVVPLVPIVTALAYSLGWDGLTGLGMRSSYVPNRVKD